MEIPDSIDCPICDGPMYPDKRTEYWVCLNNPEPRTKYVEDNVDWCEDIEISPWIEDMIEEAKHIRVEWTL